MTADTGKTWNIPANARKPSRARRKDAAPAALPDILKREKASKQPGGIYHKIQIELTYNSNHMEGSRLTHDQTRYIYETNTLGITEESVNVVDILEAANHFRCVDLAIGHAKLPLSEKFIKELHAILKAGTGRQEWFAVGSYKKMPNEAGGMETAAPEKVKEQMRSLLGGI